MSLFRKLFLGFLVLAMVIIVVGSERITLFSISSLTFSWMAGLVIPKLALILLVFLSLLVSWKTLGNIGSLKWVLVLLIVGAPIGSYLLVNIPYVNEWTKHGTDLSNEELNPIEEYLRISNPDFDGLICFYLPGCPHCEEAKAKLEVLHQRQPNLDLLIFVFTEDSALVDSYKHKAVGGTLNYLPVPNPNECLKLNRGKFPSFFYFKDGILKHRWFSSQFGYPALDWVESRLE